MMLCGSRYKKRKKKALDQKKDNEARWLISPGHGTQTQYRAPPISRHKTKSWVPWNGEKAPIDRERQKRKRLVENSKREANPVEQTWRVKTSPTSADQHIEKKRGDELFDAI